MHRVLVDAAFRSDTGHAAIACMIDGGHPIARIIETENSQQAEIEALLMAFSAAANRGLKAEEVVFVCDCQPVVYSCLDSGSRPGDRSLRLIRRALNRNSEWSLEWQPRSEVASAHQLAELTYEAWQAGYRSSDRIRKLVKERRRQLQKAMKRRKRIRRHKARRAIEKAAEPAAAPVSA